VRRESRSCSFGSDQLAWVPLIGHRDFGVAAAVDPPSFDHALGLAQADDLVQRKALDEATYRLKIKGWERLRSIPQGPNAASDKDLAERIRVELEASREGVIVFVASRPGDIRADQDWLAKIQSELKAADAYCVLLTPRSVNRPWVWFETGAAWMSEKRWVLVLGGGLSPEKVPLPLSTRQTHSIENPAGAREIFRALGLEVRDANSFAADATRIGASISHAEVRTDGWEGVEVDGSYYAWAGRLNARMEKTGSHSRNAPGFFDRPDDVSSAHCQTRRGVDGPLGSPSSLTARIAAHRGHLGPRGAASLHDARPTRNRL
jgi:hypothetical protein